MGSDSSKPLSPARLSEIRASTGLTDDEISARYKSFLAKHPSGIVTRDNFKGVYEEIFDQGEDIDKFAVSVRSS